MPSRDDEDEERARRMEEESNKNARNNDWKYLGGYFIQHYAQPGKPVPLRHDARTPKGGSIDLAGPFYPVTKGDNVNIQPGPDGQGIEVKLRDGLAGIIGDFRIETNFGSGIAITLYAGPARDQSLHQ